MSNLPFEDQIKLVQLHSISGLGDRSLFKEIAQKTNLEALLFRLKKEGMVPQISQRKAQDLVKEALNNGVKIIPFYHQDYPEPLKKIYDPPSILYQKGEYLPNDQVALGVVGTRRYTEYGRRVISELVPVLVSRGITIVSGMALGIDAFAHQACLENSGRTIAVLGSGVDVPTPMQHYRLYKTICAAGCVMSEFPLGSEASTFTFPRRNRIIAGLSLGVFIVEAGERSGALITADCALEQGKDVFTVPGSIFNHASIGTNRLLQMGAKLVTKVEDIFNELPKIRVGQTLLNELELNLTDENQQQICSLLANGDLNIDEIIEQMKIEPEMILVSISTLELKGIIKRLSGDSFCLV